MIVSEGMFSDGFSRQLIFAAIRGDLAAVQNLVAAGADTSSDIMQLQQESLRAVHAAAPDCLAILRVAVAYPAMVEAALCFAAFYGHEAVTAYLMDIAVAKGQKPSIDAALLCNACGLSPSAAIVDKAVSCAADPSVSYYRVMDVLVKKGRHDLIEKLLVNDEARAMAAGSYLHAGDLDRGTALLPSITNLTPVFWRLCLRARASMQGAQSLGSRAFVDNIDMVLAFAQARGDDIIPLIEKLGYAAGAEKIPAAADVVLSHDALPHVPGKAKLLDYMLTQFYKCLSSPAHWKGMSAQEESDCAFIVDKLMRCGASAQQLLYRTIYAGDDAYLQTAIRYGADPRRDRGRSFDDARAEIDGARLAQDDTLAARWTVFHRLELAAALARAADTTQFDAVVAGGIEALMARGAGGKTALMAGFASGRAQEIFDLFRAQGRTLDTQVLLAQDDSGYSAFDCLRDSGQAELLFDARLWPIDAADYTALWEKADDAFKKTFSSQHDTLRGQLASLQDQQKLRQKAPNIRLRPKNN